MPPVNKITILSPNVSTDNTKNIDNQELLGVGEDYFIIRKQENCTTKSLVACYGISNSFFPGGNRQVCPAG
jgi:hypothetical protein